MKIFEKVVDDERKLYGTTTDSVDDAVEVAIKKKDGTEVEFDFDGPYHYVAPGSFAGEDGDALGMFVGDTQFVPTGGIPFINPSDNVTFVYGASPSSNLIGLYTHTKTPKEVAELINSGTTVKFDYTDEEDSDWSGSGTMYVDGNRVYGIYESSVYPDNVGEEGISGSILTNKWTGEIE